jgi:pimeloyl-ACP methyl ester carboxylesterase
MMTLIIAAKYPQLVGRAMVVDIPPFNGLNFGGPSATVESVRAMASAARERYFGSDLAKSRQNTERLYRIFIRNDAARALILRQALATDREVAGRIFEESFSVDLRRELSAVRVPLTVLYTRAPNQPAADDRTDEIFRASYATVPKLKLKRIKDSGHFIMLDQPLVFQSELRDFLRS